MADYLIQHAIRERRYSRVPASTWDAVLSHIGDPGDSARLADSASNRLLYGHAIPLYRHAANAGDRQAASRLARLLEKRGNLDEAVEILRAQADGGYGYAALWLADLLEKRGDLDEAEQVLRPPTDAGDPFAAGRLVGLLEKRGDLEGLRARADVGIRRPPRGWLICWLGAVTWMACAPGWTPATRMPPGSWPTCWLSRAGPKKQSGCDGSA